MCAVDQKRPFFPRAGPFLDLLPFKGTFSLTGALTGPPYGKAPYGEASYGKAGPLQEAPYEEGRSLREGPGSRTGPSQRRKTKRLTGRPLTGRLLTRRPLTKYRKAYGKLWGGILPELGGNFRLCAVDQKRPFFPRVGPFLDLLPFKGPFSLQGPLREAPYGEGRSLREGSLTGRVPYGLREGWLPSQKKTTKRLTGRLPFTGSPLRGRTVLTKRAGPYEQGRSLRKGPGCRTAHGKLRGGTLPELGGNFRLCAVDQKRPFFPRVGPFLALLPFKGPYGKLLTGEGRPLREGSLTGRVAPFTKKDDEEAYGKAGPLWEALYGEGRSLRKGTQNPKSYG